LGVLLGFEFHWFLFFFWFFVGFLYEWAVLDDLWKKVHRKLVGWLWPPASYAGRWPLCFTAVVYFFFRRLKSRSLGLSSLNFATWSTVKEMYKIRSEIWGPFCSKLALQKHDISARFRTTSWLDCECLQNATRHRQSENGVANYGHSCIGKLNFMYFSPQTATKRTGVLTHPPATVQRTGINHSLGDSNERPWSWSLPCILV